VKVHVSSSKSSSKGSPAQRHGPCGHCKTPYSPQWRKGPRNKPVLCNACGIRYLRNRHLGRAAVSAPKHSNSLSESWSITEEVFINITHEVYMQQSQQAQKASWDKWHLVLGTSHMHVCQPQQLLSEASWLAHNNKQCCILHADYQTSLYAHLPAFHFLL
jgi:hypothetical protein